MEEIRPLLDRIVPRLTPIRGIVAVTLGGSWAAGTQHPDSDVDLGLYYRPEHPLDIPALRSVAADLNDEPNPVVTEPGGWGRWPNGGAWLTVKGQRVDFIYRDVDVIRAIIEECAEGRMQVDFYVHPPYGFRSYTYLAEVAFAVPLHDPAGIVADLKRRVPEMPRPLCEAMIERYLWSADFTMRNVSKLAHRGDVLLVAACMTRFVADLIQVAYALNGAFFLGEKSFSRDVATFGIVPTDLLSRLTGLVDAVGRTPPELAATVERAQSLFDDFVALAGPAYHPRF